MCNYTAFQEQVAPALCAISGRAQLWLQEASAEAVIRLHETAELQALAAAALEEAN